MARHRRDGVLAGPHQCGDIPIHRYHRIRCIRHLLAVEVHVTAIVGADHCDGALHPAPRRHREHRAEIPVARRRSALRARRVPNPLRVLQYLVDASRVFIYSRFVAPHPRALPVLCAKKSHGPLCRCAPIARLPVLVPHLHLPIRGRAGVQRLAAVYHVDRIRRLRFSTVPEITRVCPQRGLGRGHQNPVRRLTQTARSGIYRIQYPAQPRLGGINALGIYPIFAA